MDLGLDGRTALVTGGSKGTGLAITERLLREGARCRRRLSSSMKKST
jgi:NAD(P)-dependent dehydrogenase (short-subunit alcohol dehydrogenase family)